MFIYKNSTFVKTLLIILWTFVYLLAKAIWHRLTYSKRTRPLPSAANASLSPLDLCLSRKSVRVYDPEKRLTADEISQIEAIISRPDCVTGPFGTSIRVVLVHTQSALNQKLGTYGFIKGATSFLCVLTTPSTKLLDMGVCFEKVVLALTRMGLGTCWMAASFSAKDFASLLELKDGETISIVSPVGHAHGQPPLRAPELVLNPNMRKPFDVFFCKGTDTTAADAHFTEEEKKSSFGQVLEAVRWSPSATNTQPVRVFVLPRNPSTTTTTSSSAESESTSSSASFSVDSPLILHFFSSSYMQHFETDVGIAMENFRYVMEDQFNRKGHFVILTDKKEENKSENENVEYPALKGADGAHYWGTWIEN